jgi:predicted glycoside hydrolase/deacetylase ChbG (UPF0249 family)
VTRLIVNADDFGLTSGVNRAILELHQAGMLTSATLMARAAATDEAIEIAKATPSLGVGCHVVLIDGEPVRPSAQLPTLADPSTGRFHPKLGAFTQRLLTGRINDAEIESEARAQIQSLQSRGVRLTHVDTHKHTHMFASVLHPVLRAAGSCGIRAVRNPFEPAWSVAATPGAPLIRRMQVGLLRRLESGFSRIVAEEGFITTSGALGVLATGTLDADTIAALLRTMPSAGTFELVTHPGYNDSDLAQANTRLLASRETERHALAVLRKPAQNPSSSDLISFANLLLHT